MWDAEHAQRCPSLRISAGLPHLRTNAGPHDHLYPFMLLQKSARSTMANVTFGFATASSVPTASPTESTSCPCHPSSRPSSWKWETQHFTIHRVHELKNCDQGRCLMCQALLSILDDVFPGWTTKANGNFVSLYREQSYKWTGDITVGYVGQLTLLWHVEGRYHHGAWSRIFSIHTKWG